MFYNAGDVLVLENIGGTATLRRFSNAVAFQEDIAVATATGMPLDVKVGNGGHVYALVRDGSSHKLYQIDKDTKAVTEFYDFGTGATGFISCVNWGSDGKLYACNHDGPDHAMEISGAGALLADHVLGEQTEHGFLALLPSTTHLLHTAERGSTPPFDEYIEEYDLATDTVIGEYWTPANDPPPGGSSTWLDDIREILLPASGDIIVPLRQSEGIGGDQDTIVAAGRLSGTPVFYMTTSESSAGVDGGLDGALDPDGVHVWISSDYTAKLHKFDIATQARVTTYDGGATYDYRIFTLAPGEEETPFGRRNQVSLVA